jgi:uncharacterized RDD family membrane protein YckC
VKKVIFRILAFILDYAFVSIILLGLSYISYVNPDSSRINFQYQEYYRTNNRYNELSNKIDEYFEDGRLTEEEYDEIVTNYPDFFDIFDDIVIDQNIKTSEMEEYKTELSKRLVELNNEYGYNIQKLNIRFTIITIVVYILYFGILQYILKGQTIFKRLFKLRVVDNKNPKKRISLVKYIIRSILVCEIILSIIDILVLLLASKSNYIIFSNVLVNIKYVYEALFLVTMIVRDDARSIDDLLLNTKVVRFDKSGHIINEKLFEDADGNNEKILNKNNKIISKNAN